MYDLLDKGAQWGRGVRDRAVRGPSLIFQESPPIRAAWARMIRLMISGATLRRCPDAYCRLKLRAALGLLGT